MGKGEIQIISMKRKININISTEVELVVANDVLPHFFWTRNLLNQQGYYCEPKLHQDNTGANLLETNGI